MSHSELKHPIIIGLGITGLSVARYFVRCGQPFSVFDQAEHPFGLEQLYELDPKVTVHRGAISDSALLAADALIVSPGVSLHKPAMVAAREADIPIIGDVELFVRVCKAPIIAITGTNGKSTVTSLTGEALEALGQRVVVAGNIGAPVLDQLTAPVPDYYVLELSSFQLATTYSLAAEVAVCLNITPDHLDHHGGFEAYQRSKWRVYDHCKQALINEDDSGAWQGAALPQRVAGFSLASEHASAVLPAMVTRCRLQSVKQAECLQVDDEVYCERSALSDALQSLPQNVLAVLGVIKLLRLDICLARSVFCDYEGLAHRCQLVSAPHSDLVWYNDSKATNVGSAMAALRALRLKAEQKVIWIAGGQAKGVDVSCMKPVVEEAVAAVVLMGQDAALLQDQLQLAIPCSIVQNMQQAVAKAADMARELCVRTIVLAPACASLDQYKNYQERGEQFIQWVTKDVSDKSASSSNQ